MQRFWRIKSLEKSASVHVAFHSHFSKDRGLIDRQTYKLPRSTAVAEWQSLLTRIFVPLWATPLISCG